MPNYDYECPQCEHRFEIWQNVGDAPPPCPECNAETKKVFQVPRIIFKGSGFYVTDKRSETQAASGSSTPAKSAEKSEPSPPKTESANQSETNSATVSSATGTKSETSI